MAIDWGSIGASLGSGLGAGMQQNLQPQIFQRQLQQARKLPNISQEDMMKLYYLTGKAPSAGQQNPFLGLQLLQALSGGQSGLNIPGLTPQTNNMGQSIPGMSPQSPPLTSQEVAVNNAPSTGAGGQSGVGALVEQDLKTNGWEFNGLEGLEAFQDSTGAVYYKDPQTKNIINPTTKEVFGPDMKPIKDFWETVNVEMR